MNDRRGFLRALLMASGAAAVLDIDKLLWQPKPIITVPAMPPQFKGWSAGQAFNVGDVISFEANYAVNPKHRRREPELFTITSVVSDSNFTISPWKLGAR